MIQGHKSYYSSWGSYFKINFEGNAKEFLEANFELIRITNQIDRHYPIVFLQFGIDNQVFIEKNLYPQCELRLIINYSDEDNKIFGSPIIYDLIILEMNVDLPQKYFKNVSNPEFADINRQKCIMTCVPKQAHEMLNVTVNAMWQDPVTVKDATLEVINEVNPPSKEIDERNMNSTLLEQFIIPPMSFKNSLLHIDSIHGIYNQGKLFFFVNYNGTLFMWECKQKWEDFGNSGLYTVHKMPSYSDTPALYEVPAILARTTDDNYITYDNMKTVCMTNDPYVPHGGQQLHVFHPNWDISKLVVTDPLGEADSFGIHSSKHDLKTNNILKKRICAVTDTIGDENGSGYNAYITDNYINPAYKMNFIYLRLYRKVKPHIVMQLGQPFYLKVYSEHENYQNSNYSGKYMVTESILQLNRNQGEESGHDTVFVTCDITGVRTSQSHN